MIGRILAKFRHLPLSGTGDVFDCVFLGCPFTHEMSWMRSGTLLSQFPTYFFVYYFNLLLFYFLNSGNGYI